MSQATIQNNTVFNSSTAIGLVSGGAIDTSQSINYNNIITYSENSVLLANFPLDVDATYNWWGSTDTQAANLTIHDFKYDLNLGKVNFLPILNAQNPQAPSTAYTIQTPNTPALPTPQPSPTPTTTPTPTPTSQTPTPSPSPFPSTPTPSPSLQPTFQPELFQTILVIFVSSIIAFAVIGLLFYHRKRRNLKSE